MDFREACAWLDRVLDEHHTYRGWTLNLIASENVMSPDVARYYAIELGHRYGNYEGVDVRNRRYTGNRYLAELEMRALSEICDLFQAGAADFRPLSGHVAGSALIMALCEAGDSVLELDRSAGGHRLAERLTEARLVNLRVNPVPFNGTDFQVDVAATVDAVRTDRPRLVILGSSNYLFPTPLDDIASICRQTGTTLVLDASHVAGLIAGGSFPQPFASDVDFVVSSTHKTLAGPQGGMILARSTDKLAQVIPAVYPGLITNHHLMRIPAMLALAAEWRTYGRAFAQAVVANAVGLAKALEGEGVPVVTTVNGATQSHTILIKTSSFGRPAGELAVHLEDCGIMTGSTQLPREQGNEGLRIGVQEVTRMGLRVERISDLARLIREAIHARDSEAVRRRVKDFTADLNIVHFCESQDRRQGKSRG